MKISYAIPVCNEYREIEYLLEYLTKYKSVPWVNNLIRMIKSARYNPALKTKLMHWTSILEKNRPGSIYAVNDIYKEII